MTKATTLCIAAIFILAAVPAIAATKQDRDTCHTDYDHPDRQIEACTRVATDPGESIHERSRAYSSMSSAHLFLKQPDAAITDLDEAVKLDPDNWVPYLSRAKIYLKKGDRGRAAADIEKAKSIDEPTTLRMSRADPELQQLVPPSPDRPAASDRSSLSLPPGASPDRPAADRRQPAGPPKPNF